MLMRQYNLWHAYEKYFNCFPFMKKLFFLNATIIEHTYFELQVYNYMCFYVKIN